MEQNSYQDSSALKGRAIMIDVTSDKLEYFEDKNQFVATGSAEVDIPEQNSKLQADKIIYDQVNQLLIAEDNVKITKNGKVVNGTFARIELNKESSAY
ncbi:MAG: hypothetical protein MZU97_02745 [Bacillus subtilis]|nr:hypothetical protein [Bacillus subtilis]